MPPPPPPAAPVSIVKASKGSREFALGMVAAWTCSSPSFSSCTGGGRARAGTRGAGPLPTPTPRPVPRVEEAACSSCLKLLCGKRREPPPSPPGETGERGGAPCCTGPAPRVEEMLRPVAAWRAVACSLAAAAAAVEDVVARCTGVAALLLLRAWWSPLSLIVRAAVTGRWSLPRTVRTAPYECRTMPGMLWLGAGPGPRDRSTCCGWG